MKDARKTIIKHLARANEYAAREALKELDGEEREQARRIFAAVGITPAPLRGDTYTPKKTE